MRGGVFNTPLPAVNTENVAMETIKIEIPWGVPSKKNSYEIRFHPSFWNQVAHIVAKLKGSSGINKMYWIGPSKKVKQFENNASWAIKAVRPRIDGEMVEVVADVYVRNARCDTDNLLGCIGDALQLGIPGFNDRQIKRWTVEKFVDNRERVELVIKPMGNNGQK